MKKYSFSIKMITAGGLILAVFLVYGLSKEISRRYKINQEIERLDSEISNQEKKNKELSYLIDYLNTDSFKEIQARKNLGFQKEGEKAIAVSQDVPTVAEEKKETNVSQPTEEKNSFKKWWNYFFKPRN